MTIRHRPKNLLTLAFPALIAAVVITSASLAQADVVNVTGVTGHDGGNYGTSWGHLTDAINGSGPFTPGTEGINHGMTVNDANDPSTWTYAANSWHQEWLANSRLAGAANNKIGWAVFDFGSVTAGLDNMHLWNISDQQSSENTEDFNVYYSSGAGIDALPAMPNSKQTTGDYDFSSGDWTKLNAGGALTLAEQSSQNTLPQGTVALGGISAQYVGIEILTAGDPNDNRVGLAQVEFTATEPAPEPVPEPASIAIWSLLGLCLAGYGYRRRRNG